MHVIELQKPQCTLECSAELPLVPRAERRARIAIVGSRKSAAEILAYTKTLAGEVVEAGGIVVSGGALGADTAAHEGAINAGGITWVIAPNGRHHPYPKENKGLFEKIERGAGIMVWPFRADARSTRAGFHKRNSVLVELADALVVVQANHGGSGAYTTAKKALEARKPVWVVPPPPWIDDAEGSLLLVARPGIRVLHRSRDLLVSVGLAQRVPPERRDDANEQAILDVLSKGDALHREQLLKATNLSVSQLSMALFDLQMEGIVRERIDGRIEIFE